MHSLPPLRQADARTPTVLFILCLLDETLTYPREKIHTFNQRHLVVPAREKILTLTL